MLIISLLCRLHDENLTLLVPLTSKNLDARNSCATVVFCHFKDLRALKRRSKILSKGWGSPCPTKMTVCFSAFTYLCPVLGCCVGTTVIEMIKSNNLNLFADLGRKATLPLWWSYLRIAQDLVFFCKVQLTESFNKMSIWSFTEKVYTF